MNWHKRIEAARRRGKFTAEDNRKAGNWVTCACGEQDPRIPRDQDGEPYDIKLRDLGVCFTHAVLFDVFDEAERLLGKIEARAAELLQEAS